jgi:hypothetical protein
MPVLADRVNASDALARIPLESTEARIADDAVPALSTPVVAGVAITVVAFAAGYAIGTAEGGHKPL